MNILCIQQDIANDQPVSKGYKHGVHPLLHANRTDLKYHKDTLNGSAETFCTPTSNVGICSQ